MFYIILIDLNPEDLIVSSNSMEEPYIKLIDEIMDFKVWEVDGKYVRDKINREFTNFGQHFRFPFIPKYEFWIDEERAPGEKHFFIDHLLVEWDLMSKGMDYDSALSKGDLREKKERAKTKLMEKLKEEKYENSKKIPKDIYRERIHKNYDNILAWVINGEAVRDLYFIDYTEGGHHFVYPWVPLKEVWLDDDLGPEERNFVLLHELHERFLMAKGLDYSKAHASSSAIEYRCRHNPKLLDSYLKEELVKNQSL